MAERPLYTLYKNLKAQNFDVPDDYDKFESALTRNGKGGADNRHAIYENLKAQNFDVPDTYERFYSALFHPVSKDSSRANGGSVPMSAADKARMVSNIKAMVSNTMRKNNNVRQNIKNIVSNPKKFYQVGNKIQLGFKNPLHNKNVKEDKFAYNSTTRKTGIYRTTDGESFDNYYAASQYQNQLDQQNNAYQEAVNAGDIPSVFDVRDKNGNYDLQENIGKDGTYLTEEGAQNQLDKKLADAYARKKEIEEAIAEDNHKNGNPLLSYSASLGGGNGRDAASSDYRNKLATSLALVTQQIGALEAVKQYPTSSWGEDAWKALDNTAFTAKTWDFGLTDFATMGQMERIKTKMDNGIPLSGSDKMLLKSKVGADAAAALEDEKMGNVYRWTKIAGQSLPFMADFFLTGGYGGITKGLSRGALKIAAKRGMGKVSAAILKNTGIVMGDVIGSYAMAGTEQAMKTGADIMQRHMGNLYLDENGNYAFGTFDENGNLLHEGGETIGKALYKGLTSAMVENYTEKLFGHNYGIKKGALNFMEKHGMGRAADFFKNIGQSGWYTGSKKWMEKFGINGFAEEVMEEEIGIPLHALLDGEGKVSDLLDPKQQLDIIGGMAISVGSMYAMGIGTKPVKGAYNRAQYYRFKHKVDLADSDAQQLLGDNWEQWKEQMDNATNDKMGGVLYNILQQRDKMSKEQINAAIMYGVNLMKMRGYNLTKTAEMNAREITNEPTTPEEEKEQQIDNAYSEGHEAEAEETHEIQIDQADKQRSLAALLGISEQQLSAMSNEELDALTGQNDNLDRAIYEYQLSNAKYQGVMDNAQDQVDLAAQRAASMTDMITDQTRGTVRNATIKGTQGANDYGVYIINGNLATHDDGAINISGSDQMIIYYDPTTGKVEHADPNRFAALGDENPAEDVKAQAVADAKEKAIKEISGIIDGRVDVGSQFIVTGSDGAQHTYEILADYGDGTAAISIDGNVVENPYSIEDLQNLKDLEDQKRLEAAKAAREQLEAERGEKKAEQQKQEEEKQEQQNQVIADLIDDNGNVVLAAVEGSEDADSFIVGEYNNKKTGVKKYKVVTLNADGTVSKPRLVDASKVSIIGKMSADEYKQTLNVPDSSAVEDKSGENETVPADVAGEEVAHSSETTEEAAPANETTENDNEESAAESPAMTLEDGTIVPMLEDGNPDFSQLTAEQTAELYDEQFGEDADGVISGWVSDAKKALDKANDMSIKGKNFVEQKASKEAKEKAIADAQAAYDSAVAIRDAYNERQLAKEENTPEGRRNLIEKARRKFNRLKGAVKDDAEATLQLYQDTVGSVLHRLYDGTGIDVTDDVPLTAEEYVASSITPYSLNYEGNENSKGVKQETGLSREDFAKTRLLAKDGKGTTIDKMVDKLWNDRPSNLDSLDTQDIRAALLDLIMSGKTATDFKTYVQDMRINEAEKILEEQKRAEDNAKFAEEQKNADENEKVNEKVNESDAEDNVAESESYEESLKKALEKVAPFAKALKQAVESGDKKAIEKAQQELTDAMVSNNLGLGYLYSQLAQYGLTKRKDDSYKLSRAIMKSLKDAIQTVENSLDSAIQNAGLDGVHIDFNEAGDGWIYADKGSEWYNRLEALDNNYRWLSQDNITIDNVSKIANIIKSQIEEGERYNADADTEDETAPAEDKQFPSKLREGKQEGTTEIPEDATDEKPLGEQKAADEVPFSAKDNGNQETTEERAANVEKNKVEGTDVVDAIIGKKTRKALDRIAKMMGAKIQYQYTDKLGNGWYNADTNTIYLTLDSSITEGVQFIFGHEMTHEIKTKNAEAFEELAKLVKGSITDFDKAVDDMWKRYSKAGLSGYDRAYYEEEVIADGIGYMMRDLNYAHTLAMKMSHPLLAKIHEIINRIRMAFHGTEYTETAKNIMRSIEQAYVKTANGTFEDSTTGEDARYSLRQKPEPTKKGIGYKVFVLKNGKLYPPMVANPNGAETPVGVWLDADAAPIAGESKTGRPQVKQGGKGTQGGSGKLAYRPGWHLGVIPYALQFNRKDAEGNKTLFPANFVFAEVEYAADVDYQEEARQEGINANGKYQHSLAGLKHLPTDGYYMYRTNPNPETDPWVITGAMKVNRILTRAEQADLVRKAGREPQQIQEGDIVTDEVVNSINQQIANAPKFSLKVYHGSGADFSEFDFDHMGEGEGSQVFGWGGYVTSSKKIGKDYATRMDNDPSRANYRIQQSNGIRFKKKYPTLESFLKDEQIAKKDIFTEQEKIDYYNEKIKMAEPYHNLYEVNIPDDNGENYLDWGEKLSDDAATKIYEGLYGLNAKTLDDMAARDAVFRSLLYDSLKYPDKNTMIPLLVKTNSLTRTTMFDSRPIEDTFKSVYIRLEDWMGSPKAASQFLSSIGFTGIKYPAGTIQGGAEEGDTNYVIFKPEDMKIAEHTKFSIRTYHGSQASFDHFDHSFMGSGEGAQAYGWGTYVSEVEGIAKAYAKQNARRHQMRNDKSVLQVRYHSEEARLNMFKNSRDAVNESISLRQKNIKRKLEMISDEENDLPRLISIYGEKSDIVNDSKEFISKLKTIVENGKEGLAEYEKRKKELEQQIAEKEKVLKDLEAQMKATHTMPERNLYTVEIPDDTGDNYIGWDEPMTDEQGRKIFHALYALPKEQLDKMAKRDRLFRDLLYTILNNVDENKAVPTLVESKTLTQDTAYDSVPDTGGSAYKRLTDWFGSQKEASLFLKDAGFDGVKVIAQRNTGGNKEGKMNYVIFDENDAKITNHTKFSLKSKPVRFEVGKSLSEDEKKEVLFSLKSLENKPEGWKQANKKAIHIAETIERDPKFSLKKLDGTLIKSGTYFSGGGLVEEGLKGIIDPVVAVEYDEKISGVYRNNFGQHIVTADVRDVDPKELVKSIDGEVEFFHASPVCKNFSQAKMNHEEVELDKETAQSTADFINQVKPKVVTIENVKGYRDSEAMKTITDALDKNGYKWDADVYNAADYGGYTNRERLIVRAVREGELPEKPRKMARKNGWYEAVEDIMPTLTEKKNGVAPWMDVRLKADGIDWRNIDKPLYVMGSAYANGKIPHAFGDELLPTLRTKSGDVIVMPDGKVYRASGRVLARVSGVSDDYKMPYSEALSHTIIGNGIPTQLTEHVIAPLLQVTLKPTSPEEGGNTKFSLKQQKEKIVEDAKKNGNYMLAPNGKKTRLDAEQWVNVRTNNFKKWFGDWEIDPENASKVVDENGEPMVVYHGRSTDFNTFEKKEGVRFVMGLEDKVKAEGFFFSPDKGLAEEFAGNAARHRGGKANVVPCFLNIRKPLDLVSEGYDNKYEDVTGWSWVVGMDSQDNLWEIMDEEGMADKMKAKGYDGAIFVEEVDDNYEPTKISYCALDANQIKSADNNNGEYSSDNNDIRFSLRVDQYQHDLAQWKKDNGLSKDAERPSIPVREQNENAADFLKRVKEYRRQMALWKTAPQYEQHLLSDDTAQGQFNLELQRSTVLARIALQDSMLAIRKAQEAIMKEVGVDRLNIAEDAYTAENRSHGKGKNEFEEYNDEFLQPLRRAYNQMMKNLGKSYDNVKVYMIAKHGLERNAHIAFKYALENDYEDAAQRTAAYKAYKSDMNRLTNDADFESGKINFNTWRIQDNGIRSKYAPSYLDYRYDKLGITQDYSGLSALFDGSDFEEAAADLVKDVEDKYGMDAQALWDATNAATKKILRDSHKAGMMSDEVYDFVRGMYSHYIPLRGWGDTNADQVWNYMGGGKGAFNQTLKEAKGRGSLADDPIAYIENMAESGILINNKNWVKQHLLLLAQNHPTSLLNVSKAWYVKSVDANGNEEWIPASPNITANMTSRQVEAELEAFQKKMEAMEQNGDATQKREHLEISYPQTNSEEREHEVRVMKGGEEYVIYVNGDPQLAQAMNNTRAQRVRQGLENSISQRALAWLGRKMAAAYTSLSPLFIPSNFFRDTTMTLASTAIREDARYNYLLRKNMLTHWNTLPLVVSYQNGTLREKVRTGKASKTEQMFYDFMMNGGETGFVSSLDVEDLKKKFKNDLKDMNRMAVNPKKVGHIIMDSIETLNRAIEDSNRFMVYMTSIQYGRSIDEAVNDAKDVTLNFNRKGTGEHGWQTFRNLYLFINPAIQSLQTLGALAKHHPFKFTAVTTAWLTSGLLMPMVNNMLMSMFGGDDDKDKYWSFTKWDRRNNFIMWVPGTHDFVKIPLAQEFRGFYAVGDMIASKLWGGEKAEESWEDYGWDLMGQVVDMLPLDPTGYDGNIAVSLMPNPIRPMFELAFNVDFTGKPLFKDSEYNKYDPNFTKAYVGTPDWLVRISRMVNSIGNDYPDIQQNAIDKIGDPRYNLNNPAVVDHVLSSYLGGAYTMGSQILGVATKMLNGDEVKMADVPVASKFVGNPDDRPASKKQGDEFWTMKERHDRAANTLSKLKKLAKVDGDYSTLDVFFDSDEYKQYKLDDAKVKKYEEEKKKERAEESGDEYKAHKTTAEDIYKAHATPKDDFEDLKMSQIYPKVNGIKKSWEGLLDMVSSQADSFYNENADAIQAADEVADIREQINDIKKEFLSEDGKDAWNAEDMKEIRQLRKEALSILEKVNKVIVAKQKAKTEKEK